MKTKTNFAFASVIMAFFMWGLLTSLNDVLMPHLKELFTLDYAQAMLVQFAFFMAYAIIGFPAAKILHKIGYRWSISLGFLVAGLGCLGFLPAAKFAVYTYFLVSLFILAAGIVILQVSANPYISLLGNKKNASARLTFAQGLNSLGTTVGPIIGGVFILGMIAANAGNDAEISAKAIQVPYLILAAVMFVLCLFFVFVPLPKLGNDIGHDENYKSVDSKSIWEHKHLILGCIAIFVYVGAEVSIGSFLINYLGSDHILNLTSVQAAKYVAFYWGGAMIGRLIGSVFLTKVSPPRVVSFNVILAIILVVVSIFSEGHIAMWAIIAVGLCNSILFPTIFSLSVRELGDKTSVGSGLLCVAIVGGAIVPVVQGLLADQIGLTFSYIVPIICYCYILFFGIYGYNSKVELS